MTFLTRYYPFSLLFRERIFHYDNRYYKFARKIIEDEMKKDKKPILIDEGDQDGYFYTLIGKFTKAKVIDPDENILHTIESKLRLPKNSIFIRRDDAKTIRFLIPK